MDASDRNRLELQKAMLQAALAIVFLIVAIAGLILYLLYGSTGSNISAANDSTTDTSGNTSPLTNDSMPATFGFVIGADSVTGDPTNGKKLYKQNCARCHYTTDQRFVGPGLSDVHKRWPNKADLFAWIKSSSAYLKRGEPYTTDLYKEYNQTSMPDNGALTEKDISDILAYVASN